MNPINKKVKVNYEFSLDNEVFTIIGETRKQYQIEGDFSAGTNNVSQSDWIDKNLVKEWITPLSGIELIEKERKEQIKKHGWTIAHDIGLNNHYQLAQCASLMCYLEVEEVGGESTGEENVFDFSHCCPSDWDPFYFNKMMNKPYEERLIIAGALIVAEIERLNAIKDFNTENDFWVQCDVCKQQLKNWTGSTPCCGSIAYRVENGEVTKNIQLFASINGGDVKSTEIKTDK